MKQFFGIYLRALAVVLYVQYISAQFYDPALAGLAQTIYRILDPLLVLGLIIVVFYAYQRKRTVDSAQDDGVTREYLEANGSFYFGVVLLVGLLWNWIGFQWSNPSTVEGLLWTFIDITLPLLLFSASVQLLRSKN